MAKLPSFNLGDPLKLLSHVLNDLGLLALTWAPETLGSRSRRVKLHILA